MKTRIIQAFPYVITIETPDIDRNKLISYARKLDALRWAAANFFSRLKKIGDNKTSVACHIIDNIKHLKTSISEIQTISAPRYRIHHVKCKEYDLRFDPKGGISHYYDVLGSLKRYLRSHRQGRRHIRENRVDVHLTPNYWFNRQMAKVYEELDQAKIPTTKTDKYLGIEIEFIVPVDADLKKKLLPYAKHVSLGFDGSINTSEFNRDRDHDIDDCPNPDDCTEEHENNNEGYEGRELRILVKTSELSAVLVPICDVLNSVGAVVNKSCGLHVHFDMRGTTNEERDEVYYKLYKSLPLLMAIVPESRRKNQYCVKNSRSKPSYRSSRYRMINVAAYHEHQTFEIRLFNSTTNADKIINWIELLQKIMAGPSMTRCPKTFEKVQSKWLLSDELVAWAEERRVKFQTPEPTVTEQPIDPVSVPVPITGETSWTSSPITFPGVSQVLYDAIHDQFRNSMMAGYRESLLNGTAAHQIQWSTNNAESWEPILLEENININPTQTEENENV
jgi:hypothetical protein